MHMRRLTAITLCLVVLSLPAVFRVNAQPAEQPGRVTGQPVASEDPRPRAGTDYRALQGYTLDRIVSGLNNPMAIAADPDGNVYIADGVKPETVNIIRLKKNGTVTTIARGIKGSVSALVYTKGYLYAAIDSPRVEILRIGPKTETRAALYRTLNAGRRAPRRIIDMVQNPENRNADLYILDKNPETKAGTLWRVGTVRNSMSTVANPVPRGTVNRGMLTNPWVAGLSLLGLALFAVIAWILMRRPKV